MKMKFLLMVSTLVLSINVFAHSHVGASLPSVSAKTDNVTQEKTWQDKLVLRQTILHKKLLLSPEQEPAWQAYNQIVLGKKDFVREKGDVSVKLSAPDQIRSYLDRLKTREIYLTKLVSVTDALYAVLNIHQRVIFDDSVSHTGKMMHHQMHMKHLGGHGN